MIKNYRYQALVLLSAELLLIATSMFWKNLTHEFWVTFGYTVFFCLGGYALSGSKKWLGIYMVFALGVLSSPFSEGEFILSFIHMSCLSALQLMLFFAVVRHCFFNVKVNRYDRILSGVAGYLLLGIVWSAQFNGLSSLGFEPLKNLVSGEQVSNGEGLYFSFVTLTTLGFGDIVPVTPLARILTVFTTLSGTLYLAIFISTLISRVAQAEIGKETNEDV